MKKIIDTTYDPSIAQSVHNSGESAKDVKTLAITQTSQIRKLSDLEKLPNNPRTISTIDMARLETSIRKFGILEGRPLILSNRTGKLVIIGGNMRYEDCKKIGIDEVPTYLIEGLSEEDEREIIIRDNVSNGEWDMDALANDWDIQQLSNWGVEVQPLVTKDEEKEMIEDNVPELIDAIYVQEGDIFQLGNHTLMCGDSMNEEDIKKLIANKNGNKTHCINRELDIDLILHDNF